MFIQATILFKEKKGFKRLPRIIVITKTPLKAHSHMLAVIKKIGNIHMLQTADNNCDLD